jgi:hypothetical protein
MRRPDPVCLRKRFGLPLIAYERFDFDNVKFTGYAAVPEPRSVVLLINGPAAGCSLKRRR